MMWPNWQENKPFSLALIVLLAFLSIFTWAKTSLTIKETAQVGKAVPTEHAFSIDGEAKVTGAPDIAKVSFGVQTKTSSVAQSQKQNTETTNTLLAKVKGLGVAEADIQTSDYNSYQSTVWDPKLQNSVADGWIVSQQVTVKVRDTAKLPDLLQTLGQNGATNISGPNFSVDDLSALKADAREKAIAEAQAKADDLAKKLGVRFERITGYNEYVDNGNPTPYAMGMGGADLMKSSVPQIAPGSVELTMHVTLTYKLAE